MVYMRFIKVLFFTMAVINLNHAQNYDPISIPFEVDGIDLQNPLIGGLLAPQFESFDLDGQGAEDLIVFERNGDVILPFINLSTPGNPNYVYAPEYTSHFPDVIKFVKLVDFNNDGKKDIFALAKLAPGIEVWRNTSEGDDISFEFMKFNFGLGDFLQILSGGNYSNLYMSSIDIPAILDVDEDGDLDILTFDTGGSYMNYYQNMVKEMGLTDDTLVYRLSDLCWGNFFESGDDEGIALSTDRDQCAFGLQSGNDVPSVRHAGSTVTAFDADGDQDLDLLIGDISNRGLVFLENDEIDGDPFIIDQNVNFPSNSEKPDIFIFLSSFFIDMDNDGKRDLIICPNNEKGSDNINHIWYYNNVGEDDAPIFELVQKDFLLETTLRMGYSSHPCFIDFNNDGLSDLLVGMNRIYSDGESQGVSMYLYENVGTQNSPAYKLIDDDYLDLADDLPDSRGFLAPTSGDLDGDGDDDIIIADNNSYLFYFENKAGPNEPYEFDNYIYQYKNLRVGTNGNPAIIDLDQDGLSDIIVGEKNDNGIPDSLEGGVNFYKNIGAIGSPDFEAEEKDFPNTNILGQVFTRTISDTSGESAPHFFYSGDKLMLAVGSRSGNIYIYEDIIGNIYDKFTQVTAKLPILNAGIRTSVAMKDIDNDGYHEMIVGNDSGGLMAFNTEFEASEPLSTNNNMTFDFSLQPNPTSDFLKASIPNLKSGNFSIYKTDGSLVSEGALQQLKEGIDVSSLVSGFYLISIESPKGPVTSKFVKL